MASSWQQLSQVVWEIRIQSESCLQTFSLGKISALTIGELLHPRSPRPKNPEIRAKVRTETIRLTH